MRYWTVLFSDKGWQQFLEDGGTQVGFKRRRWRMVQEISVGDILLAYMTGLRSYIGVLTVTDTPRQDNSNPIWDSSSYSVFVPARIVAKVDIPQRIPIASIQSQISYFKGVPSLDAHEEHFQESPIPEMPADAKIIIAALHHRLKPTLKSPPPASSNGHHKKQINGEPENDGTVAVAEIEPEPSVDAPIEKDESQPEKTPTASIHTEDEVTTLEDEISKVGEAAVNGNVNVAEGLNFGNGLESSPQRVSVFWTGHAKPTSDNVVPVESAQIAPAPVTTDDSSHGAMQALLIELGHVLNLSIWIKPADRKYALNGHTLGDMPGIIEDLPGQGSIAVDRLLEMVDVAWVDKGHVMAVFELENSATFLRGLLRLLDLNILKVPFRDRLYIVAPKNLKTDIMAELERPTLQTTSAPLLENQHFICFDELKEKFEQAKKHGFLKYLQPEFIDDVATNLK